MTVTPAELIEQAKTQSGLSDLGDDWFMGPLGAWCKDLGGTHLSERGQTFLTRLAVNDIVRRARIVDCLNRNPDIENTAVPKILYITGHERSGTTLLHNLLSLHQGARYLSRWELMMPVPPPDAGTFNDDPRRAVVQKSIDALRGSDLESMHWVDAHDPEECVWAFMDCTGLLGQAPAFIMPNWLDWLQSNDLTPTFQNYRKVIQILTWKNPVPDGGFLVLKAPQITRNLSEFGRAFPEARFVFTHRDPFRVLTSMCTLADIVNKPFLLEKGYLPQAEKQDRTSSRMMEQKLSALGAFDEENPHRVINVNYVDLVERPVEEVLRVYAETEFPADTDLGVSVNSFIEQQKAGHRAKPRRELSSYGYVQDEVLAKPTIANYVNRFNVTKEMTRRTGAD